MDKRIMLALPVPPEQVRQLALDANPLGLPQPYVPEHDVPQVALDMLSLPTERAARWRS